MASKAETGMVERSQAALEAVELLREAGFYVENFDIDPTPRDMTVDLDLTLSIDEDERPLEVLE